MTLKIEVSIPEEDVRAGGANTYLDSALSALGYRRQVYPAIEQGMGYSRQSYLDRDVGRAGVAYETTTETADKVEALVEAAREAAAPAEKPKRSSSKKETPKPAISTGEERVGPEDAETAKQDAADEAAEHAGKTTLTLDDVRKAFGRYQKKHGFAAAAKDVPAILGCAIADIPDDQEALVNAVQKIDGWLATDGGYRHAEENAFDDAPAAPAKEHTKGDVKAAMLAYGEKFDKTSDPNAMAFTKIDVSKIFMTLFGADVKALSQVPATPEAYGRAVDAITRAMAEDPYNRGA